MSYKYNLEHVYYRTTTIITNFSFLDLISGPGLLLDIHGQGHSENWIELGYAVTGSRLDSGNLVQRYSTIRSLAASSPETFDDLLRSGSSLGGILQDSGYKVVPSPNHPGPDGGNYYSGGYISKTYGSKYGGDVDAIQIESPRSLRSSSASPPYAQDLAQAIVDFMDLYYQDA